MLDGEDVRQLHTGRVNKSRNGRRKLCVGETNLEMRFVLYFVRKHRKGRRSDRVTNGTERENLENMNRVIHERPQKTTKKKKKIERISRS
jgi:hypothetical protein